MEHDDIVRTLRDTQSYLRWLQGLGQHMDLSRVSAPVTKLIQPEAPPSLVKEAILKAPSAEHEVPMPPSGDCGTSDECLDRLDHIVQACRKCRLGYSRTQAVFGSGNRAADLMFIGEAPGANEDKTGLPFVGQAGKVLTAELEKNGIKRDDVFICNIIKCRPPDNRDPLPDEIAACTPYLHEQIELIKPKMLCGLGRYACTTLMGEAIKIMKIRGTWSKYQGLPLFICLHPSAVLHQPNNRQLFNDDVAALAKAYHER